MKITIPPSKSLVVLVANGSVVQAFLEGDADIPDDITKAIAKGEVKPQPFDFVRHFIGQLLLSDAAWGKDMSGVYMAQEIRGAFHGSKPGDVVEIPKATHERLLSVMKNPSTGYAAPTLGLALDFFRAIETATENGEDAHDRTEPAADHAGNQPPRGVDRHPVRRGR
jgi:hypothetical protein